MPWEETENEIRERVRDPGDFQEDSFRRIPFKRDRPRVFAVVGRLKGETTTTVQALRFPKEDDWTIDKAKTWVKEHFKKSLEGFSEQTRIDEYEYKSCALDLKSIGASGEFEGLAAVYNTPDLLGDIIMPGAFAKTLLERGPRLPLRHNHGATVGIAEVADSEAGLIAIGHLNLEKQVARDVYADMKFFRDNKVPFGLSIGFLPVPGRTEWKSGARLLRETKLFEISLAELPLHPSALVSEVKAIEIEGLERIVIELKEGRAISAARAARLRAVAKEIMALLEDAGAEQDADTTSSGAAKSITPTPELIHLAREEEMLRTSWKRN